jgi:hypothetical protein
MRVLTGWGGFCRRPGEYLTEKRSEPNLFGGLLIHFVLGLCQLGDAETFFMR